MRSIRAVIWATAKSAAWVFAMAMQGSGISSVDTGSVIIKVNDDGFYSLMIGATDMGTGCDTILTQMAAECLDCENVGYHCPWSGYGYLAV